MWWIIPVILLLLCFLLLCLRYNIIISYSKDFTLKVGIMFFSIPIYPFPSKKLNPNEYSVKRLKAKEKKNEKKKQKQKKKVEKKPAEQKPQPTTKEVIDQVMVYLRIIKTIIRYSVPPFGSHLTVTISKLNISIGGKDPSESAIAYGLISQGLSYIIGWLDHYTNVVVKKNSIKVYPDFFSEEFTSDIKIVISLRTWHFFSIAVRAMAGIIPELITNREKYFPNKSLNQNQEAHYGQQTE